MAFLLIYQSLSCFFLSENIRNSPKPKICPSQRNIQGKNETKSFTLKGTPRRRIKVASSLKGQCHEIFCFRFFSWITFPQAPDNNIRIISNFFENSRRYSHVKVHHWYQRHRRQILPPVPLVLLTPVANLPTVSTIPAENLPPVSMTPLANWHRYQRHRRQICHRCHWHRWQIIGTISGCRHLKLNLKAKLYIYASSTTQRWPNKIIKTFLIEDFFHSMQTLSCEYLREFSRLVPGWGRENL